LKEYGSLKPWQNPLKPEEKANIFTFYVPTLGRSIETYGDVFWPARLPDLTALDNSLFS